MRTTAEKKTCRGVLHLEILQGILIKSDGVYESRCPSCGHRSSRKTMPVPGTKCRKPVFGK